MTFLDTYREELERAVRERPEVYGIPVSEVQAVFERMRLAIIADNFNKDSISIARTCRRLKIPFNYIAIATRVQAENPPTQ